MKVGGKYKNAKKAAIASAGSVPTFCTQLKRSYGVVPGTSWGVLPRDKQLLWSELHCDDHLDEKDGKNGGEKDDGKKAGHESKRGVPKTQAASQARRPNELKRKDDQSAYIPIKQAAAPAGSVTESCYPWNNFHWIGPFFGCHPSAPTMCGCPTCTRCAKQETDDLGHPFARPREHDPWHDQQRKNAKKAGEERDEERAREREEERKEERKERKEERKKEASTLICVSTRISQPYLSLRTH